MQIIGIGTDITECTRIERMLVNHGESFKQRVFTAQEIEYCGKGKQAVQHFTGRWSAKEAILKAMGTGWSDGISWNDIEILNEISGKPVVTLFNQTLMISHQLGIKEIQVSISHCNCHAVAFAVALGNDPV